MKPNQLFVFTPAGEQSSVHTLLKPGTAIVAKISNEMWKNPDDVIMTWYEEPGTISNVVTFEDRLTHAAGRLVENYPTSKITGFYQRDLLIAAIAQREEGIGWHISQMLEMDALIAWTGETLCEGGSPKIIRERISRRFQAR